mmetsp:Transcript_70254/g.124090  ORF Transcript_70254/g.124090 Transcript_70254/m.124090 type:complete len:204 (+) Transcript_70254:29-640(+)
MTNYDKWAKFAADVASDSDKEEEKELEKYTKKRARFIHVPPGAFSNKEQICKLLEEDMDFEAPSSAAAGIMDEGIVEPGVARAIDKYKWSSVGSQFLPGYGPSAPGTDMWRIFFDDNFLTTQKEPNKAARALIGHKSLGSFVVSCVDRNTKEDRAISLKEVADLIIRRQQGGDAERIGREHGDQRAQMDSLSSLGVETVELDG